MFLVDNIIYRLNKGVFILKKSICIKTNNNQILNYLLTKLVSIPNIYFSKRFFKNYTNIIIHYIGNDIQDFYNNFSNVLAKLIIDFFDKKLIFRIININYFYFSEIESKNIFDNTLNILSSNEFNENDFIYKDEILKKCIIDYFKENKSMVLEGFVNFRLKPYLNILEDAVELAVTKFIIQREYDRLIDLLRLYINTQKSNISLVHLIYLGNTSFLVDENKNLINIEQNCLDLKYLSDISFSSNDYILNCLLNLLPKKVHLHLVGKEDEFINTLKLIFENRLIICTECNICQLYRNNYAEKYFKN